MVPNEPYTFLHRATWLKASLFSLLLGLNICSCAQEWEVTLCKLKFEITNFGSLVEGSFSNVQNSILFNPSDIASSSISSIIAIASIDTGNKTRDRHLRGEDYFNESSYKQIIFKSKEILPASQKGKYVVKGNLTIKNVTKEVSIPFSFEEKESTGVFSGSLTLNRLDYHVGSPSWILGDEVKITIELNAIKITE